MGTTKGDFPMRKLSLTIASLTFASLLAGGAAHANGVDFEAKCSGGANAYDQVECQSFAAGVVAGLQISPHPHICFPPMFDRRQALPIVLNWMQMHPEMLHWGAVHLIRQSLRESYPCGNGIPPISN
jgi:Rap1a immunity proteins